MSRKIALPFAMLLAVAGAMSASAFEWPAVLSGKSTVKEIADYLNAKLQETIGRTGLEGRITLTHAFQQSQLLIDGLASAYEDSLHLTFDELDDQQKKALEDSWNLINNITTAAKPQVSEAIRVADGFSNALLEVAIWAKKPVVYKYTPEFISPSGLSKAVSIRLDGFKLNGQKPPVVKIGDTEIPGEATNNTARFVVPRSVFPAPHTEPEYAKATVVFFHDSTSIFRPWTYIWPTVERSEFGLVFTVLPEKLGTYQELSEIQVVSEERSLPINFKPLEAFGDGGSDVKRDCYQPTAGWKFDVNTADVVKDAHLAWYLDKRDDRYNKGRIDIDDERYPGVAKSPEKICIIVSAIVGAKEEKARSIGHLRVIETRPVYSIIPDVGKDTALSWVEPVDLPMKDESASQRVKLVVMGLGDIYAVSQTKLLPFISIEPDTRARRIFIKPRRDW